MQARKSPSEDRLFTEGIEESVGSVLVYIHIHLIYTLFSCRKVRELLINSLGLLSERPYRLVALATSPAKAWEAAWKVNFISVSFDLATPVPSKN